jgi:hypothetical protein
VKQVDIFCGHLQTAWPAHPHDIGAEVGQHHRGVRTGPDAAELDDPDTGKRSGVSHSS